MQTTFGKAKDHNSQCHGKIYIRSICKKCYSENICAKRKIVGSKEWFSKRFNRLKDGAKKRGIEFNLTFKETCKIYATKNCYFCGDAEITRTIDRLNNLNGYNSRNCVMACLFCNKLKRNIIAQDKKRMLMILDKL